MNLAEISIRRPVSATMLIAFLVALGLFSYRGLAVDLFPNVDFPIVTVTTTLRGASVEEVESGVTKPLEEAINTIEGVDELRSETKEGLSQIIVFFALERNGEHAAQDVRDRVSSAIPQLPEGTDPPLVNKFNVDAAPIMDIVVAGDRDLREVTEIARRQIKENIETIRGVGSVTLVGGLERAINVAVDTNRLSAYSISIEQVKVALRQQNLEVPSGRVDQGSSELTLRTMGRVTEVEDFSRLIIGNIHGRPVTIGDVGTVADSHVEPRALARLDGEPAVSLLVRKQAGTNTVEVIDDVKERLAELRAIIPGDISVRVVRDQSRFIKRSIAEVRFHLLLAAVLVSLTVLLFINNLRATLIAAVAIPTSLVSTFTLMSACGFTLNNITMLGLVLATGIVIDDAVVVLENIFRHCEESGESPARAAAKATREIAMAVTATTLSLVVIFLPVAFMSGQVGRFFNSYGVTVAGSIMVSLLVSFTLTPMLCARFLRVRQGARGRIGREGIYGRIERWYEEMLRWSLRHRWVIVLLSVLTTAATVPLFRAVGKDFVPHDDQSEFEITLQAPEGYTLARTDGLVRELEAALRRLPGVTHLLASVGDTTGRLRAGEGPVTRAAVYVQLADLGARELTQFELMDRVRALLVDFPDLRASVQNVSVFVSGTRLSDIELNVSGPDLQKLAAYSEQLVDALRQTPGFVDVDTTLSVRQPEMRVHIDRERASAFGINVADIASTLRTLVGGEVVSKYKEGQEQYDVWLRAEKPFRADAEALKDLSVPAPGGGLVSLANLATLSEERGPAQIDRYNRQRKVTIVANLRGIALGEAVARINGMVRDMQLPPGYQASFSGNAKSLRETGENFAIAFGLSLLFMYMILAAQFESFSHPITILLALPLSIPFALASLLALDETLNVYSVLGLFMLFGIVKKNGILQIDYTNVLRAQGMQRDAAILRANQVRLRPILMTTVMLVAGMIPIALGQGPGSASRASMAKVIIGGQTLCLLLTLLLTPVAYSLFDDLGRLPLARRVAGWIRGVAVRRPAFPNGRTRA